MLYVPLDKVCEDLSVWNEQQDSSRFFVSFWQVFYCVINNKTQNERI